MMLRGLAYAPDDMFLHIVRDIVEGMTVDEMVDSIHNNPDLPTWFKAAKGINTVAFQAGRQLFLHASEERQLKFARAAMARTTANIIHRRGQRRDQPSKTDFRLEVLGIMMSSLNLCTEINMKRISVFDKFRTDSKTDYVSMCPLLEQKPKRVRKAVM